MARQSFALPDELDVRLRSRAAELERSVGWCLKRALEEWLAVGSASSNASAGRRAAGDAGASPGRPAAPRAPAAAPPPFARVTSLGGAPRPVPRRGSSG